MTAAGNAIPAACSSANATGWSPACRSCSSSRCCWASAGVIDRLSPSSEIARTRAFQAVLLDRTLADRGLGRRGALGRVAVDSRAVWS
jgi:hypothetical protein